MLGVNAIYIGGYHTKNTFKGALDDIRIYNVTLSPLQVRALYGAGGWPNITYPSVTLSLATFGPVSLCPGDSTQLSATLSGSGRQVHWLPADGLALKDSMSLHPVVRPGKTTTYTAIATSGEPCPQQRDTQRITITVNEPPKPYLGGVAYLCAGDTLRLSATITGGKQPLSYQWSPPPTIDNPVAVQPRVWPKTTMRYYLTVTDANGCKGSDSVQVTVYSPPIANAGRDTIVCRGSGVNIGMPGTAENKYHWTPATGLSDTAAMQPLARPDTTTRYYLSVTSATGCHAYDSVLVRVNPSATVDAGADTTICQGSSLIIGTAAQAGYAFHWAPAAGLNNPAVAQPTAQPAATTTYYLTAINGSGCAATDSVTVTVLRPKLEVAPATLDFGKLDGCTSTGQQTVDITNNGDVPITIGDATSDNASFSIVSPPRPIVLAPGQKVTVTIRYAPSAAGAATGNLTFSGVPCSVSVSVDLKGDKEQSQVAADISSIDFGHSLVCRSIDSTTEFTVRNSGTSGATVGVDAIAAPFSVVSPTLPATVVPGGSLKIRVRYAPSGAGSYSADLKLPYASGTCRDTMRLALSGSVEKPTLTAAAAVDFGTLSGCETGHDTTLTISNSGTIPITLDSASIPAGYRLSTGTPLTVPAGESRTITLRFEPAASGSIGGALTLHYGPCNGQWSIALSGSKQGVAFSLPDSIAFGQVLSCREDSKTLSLAILFTGDAGTTGSIGSLSINGPFTTTLKPGDALANGAPTSFDVTYKPTQDGPASGSIDVSLQPCGITRHIALRGDYMTLELIPSSLAFGTQPVGSTTTKPVMFINSSSLPILIGSVDGIVPPFSIVSTNPPLPATLGPGDTLHIQVGYTATRGGSRDTLHAQVTEPCTLGIAATLDGVGEDGATATVSLPIVEAVPGEHLVMPLMLVSSNNLDGIGAEDFTMQVAFNRTLLLPYGSTPIGIQQGGERLVTVTGKRPTGMSSGELMRLEFAAALGDTTYTPVAIRSFTWLNADARVTTRDGGVTIKARDGWKLFLSNGTLRLQIKPNPARESAEIDYEVIEPGRTTLTVRNAIGEEVGTLLDTELKPGPYSLWQELTEFAAGVYYYVLKTPGGEVIAPVVVVH